MGIISSDRLPEAKSTLPKEEVSLQEFGIDGSVYVRALTSEEERAASKYGKDQDPELNAYIASKAAIDDNGEPVFRMSYLKSAYGKMARHLAAASMRLSGIMEGEEDIEGKD